ncbi:MAG: hypothetical protein SWO11_14680 [Thermodesulfobacteriota bacterium]|nr:hypothetical protein [Thermodesulfobacteriota bacterium]
MAKKRSLKKVGHKTRDFQKSKDQKRVFSFIERLEHKNKQIPLNPEQVHDTVNELKKIPCHVQALERIVTSNRYSLIKKLNAFEILRELGAIKDDGLYGSLKEAYGLIQDFQRFLQDDDMKDTEPPAKIIDRIYKQNDSLQRSFVHQLIDETEGNSLLILTQLIGKNEGLDSTIAESLADLPIPESSDLLCRIAINTDSKAVKKTVKKSLYRLREKGIVTDDKKIEGPHKSVLRPTKKVSEGFLSPIDQFGDRLIWLIRPRASKGLYFFEAVISDTYGIREFKGVEITKKQYKEYREAFEKGSPIPMVEAEESYCRFLIDEAHMRTAQNSDLLPEEYLKWKDRIGKAPYDDKRPLIYSYYGEDTIRNESHLKTRFATLLELPEFSNWQIEIDEIREYTQRIQEANESKLVLTPIQKKERLFNIQRDAIEELFDEKRCLLYKRRLEEMAYVLYKLGKEEDARTSLAAALTLNEKGILPCDHLFLLGLTEKSLSSAILEEEQKARENPSFIIKP